MSWTRWIRWTRFQDYFFSFSLSAFDWTPPRCFHALMSTGIEFESASRFKADRRSRRCLCVFVSDLFCCCCFEMRGEEGVRLSSGAARVGSWNCTRYSLGCKELQRSWRTNRIRYIVVLGQSYIFRVWRLFRTVITKAVCGLMSATVLTDSFPSSMAVGSFLFYGVPSFPGFHGSNLTDVCTIAVKPCSSSNVTQPISRVEGGKNFHNTKFMLWLAFSQFLRESRPAPLCCPSVGGLRETSYDD